MSETSLVDGLIFCTPDEIDESEYNSYIQEFLDANEEVVPGAAHKPEISFKTWLTRCSNESRGTNLEPGRVPGTLYFLVNKQTAKILGCINIRHRLNGKLIQAGGNIGYGVRPSERQKGYATLMLKFALTKCKELGIEKVLVTCASSNKPSEKTILKCGGIFENEISDYLDGKLVKRFWIKC